MGSALLRVYCAISTEGFYLSICDEFGMKSVVFMCNEKLIKFKVVLSVVRGIVFVLKWVGVRFHYYHGAQSKEYFV